MKTESLPKYVLRLAGTLLAICVVVAGLLAAVNSITAPIIEEQDYQKVQQAIEAVLPGGGEAVTDFTDDTGLIANVYASDIGYAFEVAPAGFGGAINMMVGVDKEGNVLGISIVSHSETAGLGAVAAAETPKGIEFREQFVGQSGSVTVTKDGGQIVSITGATISSRAICVGINAALDCAAKLG